MPNPCEFNIAGKKMNSTEFFAYAKGLPHGELNEILGGIPSFKNIPEAPFVTDTNQWVKLGLKMAIRFAVADGSKKIAWTTGEQQNDRYDLRKQVDNINYSKNEDGTYRVYAQKDGGTVFTEKSIKEKDLEGAFGKDVAAKIINNEGAKKEGLGSKVLQGDNLKVGGKGMIGFYGSPEQGKEGIVGSVAKALVKELTGVETKIGETKIETKEGSGYTLGEANYVDGIGVYDSKGDMVAEFDTKKEANDFVVKKSTSTQHSIEITPELKASVQQGMPMFATKSEMQSELEGLRAAGFSDADIKELYLDLGGVTEAEIDSALNAVSTDPNAEQIVSGITHVITGETREEYGLPEYQREKETFAEWDAKAKERIQNNEIGAVLNKIRNGETPSAVEQRMMGLYVAQLDEIASKSGSNEDIAKLFEAIELSDRIGGSETARSLVARKGLFETDKTLGGYWVEQMEHSQVDTLTQEQKDQNKKEFDEITSAKEALEKKVAELEKQNAALIAQKNIKGQRTKTNTKKTSAEFKEERQKYLDNISKKLKEIRNTPSAVAVPYARELFAVAPDVTMLVKSLAEQGIIKLADVVKEVHDNLKPYINEITNKDVIDLIAGEYNAEKKTKSELAIKLRDLREEAKLTKRLVDLLEGKEPESAGGKVIRNKEITELRKKIKEFKSENKGDKEREVADLNNLTKKYNTEYDIVKKKLDKGDYQTEEKKIPILQDQELKKNFPKEYKEALDAKDKLIKLKLEREVRLLKEEQANRSKFVKGKDALANLLNLPRSIMSSIDFSAPLRQGIIPTIAHPLIALKAFKEMFEVSISQKKFDRYFNDLRESEAYNLMDNSGLYIADPLSPKLAVKEEAFMSNLAERIPLIGAFVKGSERAYVSYLNKMRVDLFVQGAVLLQDKGKTFENSSEAYKALAGFVNNSTGRGGMTENLEKAAPILNSVFFSPRLIASRLNLLNPVYYVGIYRKDPQVGRMLLGDMAKFAVFTLSVLALAKMGCGDDKECGVETDARSTDFGKIKIKNTRYDIWGGFQQYIRFITQIWSGQSKTVDGKIMNISGDDGIEGKKSFGSTRISVFGRFARGKLAPIPATLVDIMSKRTVMGEKIKMEFSNPFKENKTLQKKEIDLTDKAKTILLPLIISDVKEAYKEQGIKSLGTVWLPATFGIGVQTFQKNK